MVLPSSHVSLPATLVSPQLVLQTWLEVAVPPEQVYPHSNLHEAEQPSPAAVFPSSQKFAVLASFPTVLPSPHLSVHTDSEQVSLVHPHPDSTRQLALHPSPLMVLPSSHLSLPASLESPQLVLQTLGCAAVQLYPHSTAHPALQPSPSAVLPSSHPSEVVLIPFPQTSVQFPALALPP